MSKYVQLNLFDLGGSAASVFKIFPSEAHTGDLRDRTELAGGIVLEPDEEDPHAIPLVDIKWLSEQPEELLNNIHIPSECFFSTFIYDCYEWERLFDLNPYRVGDSKYFPYDANEILQRRLSWPELRLKPVFEPISAEKLRSQYETPRKRRNLHDSSLDGTIEIDLEQDTGIIPTAETHQDLEGGIDDPDMDASLNLNPVSVEIRHDEELVLRRIDSEEDDAVLLSDDDCIPPTPKTPKTSTNNTSKPRKNQSPRNSTKASPKNTPKANRNKKSDSSVGSARQKNGTPGSSRKNSKKNGNDVVVENGNDVVVETETVGFGSRTPQKSARSSARKQCKKSPERSPSNLEPGGESQDESEVTLNSEDFTAANHPKIGNDVVVENETVGFGSRTPQRSARSSARKERKKSPECSPSNLEPGEESQDQSEVTISSEVFTAANHPINGNDVAVENGNDEVVETETVGFGSRTPQKSARSSARKQRKKSPERSPSNLEPGEESQDETEVALSSKELDGGNHSVSPSKSPVSALACNGHMDEDVVIVNDMQDSVQKDESGVVSNQQQRSRKRSGKGERKKRENCAQEGVEAEIETSPLVDNTETSTSVQENTNDHESNTVEDVNNEEADVEITDTRKSKKNSQRKRQKKLHEAEDVPQVEIDNLSPSTRSTIELKKSTSAPSETPSKKTKKSKGKAARTVVQTGEKNVSPRKSKKTERKRKKSSQETLDPSDVPETSHNEPKVSEVPTKSQKKSKKSKNLPSLLDTDAPTQEVEIETAHQSASISSITTKRVMTSVESSDSGFYQSKRRRKSINTSESNSSSSSMPPLQLPPVFSSSEDSLSETTTKTAKKKNKKKSSKTEKSFACSSCPFATSEEINLVHHMRLHTGEIKFQCTYCSFSATDKSSLKNHRKLHSQGGQLCCIMCDFTTSDTSQLQAHCKSHDGTKTYECPTCSFKASTAYKLRVHRTKIHPEL